MRKVAAILTDLAGYRNHLEDEGSKYTIPINALIFSDYSQAPTVVDLDVRQYQGHVGQIIRVIVDDAFEGYWVGIVIRDAIGKVLETGSAQRTDSKSVIWTYQTTVELRTIAGALIEVTAKDRPGNSNTRMHLPAPIAAVEMDSPVPAAAGETGTTASSVELLNLGNGI